jgi:hypothetical protein
LSAASAAVAQGYAPVVVAPAQPVVATAVPQRAGGTIVLRQGTSVALRTMTALNSRHSRVGERFNLEVAEPVRVNGHIVVPIGARAVGEITRVIKKGAFGKSGKLETRLLYAMVGDQQVRLDGQSREAGAGGTAATVGVAVAAGIFSAFVTGKSADIPPGSTMTGFTAEDLPLMLVAAAPAPMPGGYVAISRR